MKPLKKLRHQVTLHQHMRDMSQDVDDLLEQLLADPGDLRRRLYDAMRYAAIGGGKRLRPLLVEAASGLFGVSPQHVLRVAVAVECVHVQSLIHDDLPCMDDDDLRRGKPTLHLAYNEATAVLAGDALLALGFEILADPATHPEGSIRAELVLELARAAGAAGMAGGQMLDLLPSTPFSDIHQVTVLQQLKTGALISWCVEAGAILGGASASERGALRGYAHCLGLAFQIADDLLDHTGDEQIVGKRLGKDETQGKDSFVGVIGPGPAARYAELLILRACQHLEIFGPDAALLTEIAHFSVSRDR